MKKKIDAKVIVKGVLGDMKYFFPRWFPLVLKMSVLWVVCQLLLYFIVGGGSLEGFLWEVSYAWIANPVLGGGDGQGLFLHSVFLLCVLVSGIFVQSGVGSAWLMYGRSGGGEGGKSLPLWNGRGLFFLWVLIKFSVLTILASTLISLVLLLGVMIVFGVLILFLGFVGASGEWLAFLSGAIGLVGFLLGAMTVGVVFFYVGIRFCLVFAGFARGESVGLFESWRGLKGYGVPLIGIGFFVFLLPALVSFLREFFFGVAVALLGGSGSVVGMGFGMVSFVLGVVISIASMIMFMMAVERIDGVLREGVRGEVI